MSFGKTKDLALSFNFLPGEDDVKLRESMSSIDIDMLVCNENEHLTDNCSIRFNIS
jgi:hypothetical protein